MEKCATRGLRNPAATEGARERAAAAQGRPATKFMPFRLRSVLGRRMLIQHLCIGLLPIVALASVLYMQPNSALREVGDKFLLIAAITVALALALGVRQVRRSVEPLERLLAGMRRIARQDFSALIPAQ